MPGITLVVEQAPAKNKGLGFVLGVIRYAKATGAQSRSLRLERRDTWTTGTDNIWWEPHVA